MNARPLGLGYENVIANTVSNNLSAVTFPLCVARAREHSASPEQRARAGTRIAEKPEAERGVPRERTALVEKYYTQYI